MVFIAQTVTIWNPPQPDAAVRAAADKKSGEMAIQGLTDGIAHRVDLPDGQAQITRNWTTVDAANEWAAFVAPYGPQSTEVILL